MEISSLVLAGAPHYCEIRYENLDLLKAENQYHLKQDLQNKLGCSISKIDIEFLNYHEGYANLKITLSENRLAEKDIKVMHLKDNSQRFQEKLYSAS